MKHIIAFLFALGMAAIIVLGLSLAPADAPLTFESKFLRMHIRANSDMTADQEVKYKVKQEVVNALTPLLVNITDREQAMDYLNKNLALIDNAANNVLRAEEMGYTARSALRTEYFPTRVYNGVSLSEGVYDALIIELGEAEGANWWCVVYPPLCFLENNIGGNEGVQYRSKLQELIKRFF